MQFENVTATTDLVRGTYAAHNLTSEMRMFLVLHVPMKLVIIVGNLLTVVTIAVDRSRHTTAYVFTATLAVADLLIVVLWCVLGLTVVYDILLLTIPYLHAMMSCPVNFVLCSALAESSQCIALIALDRTLGVKYPLRYHVWMNRLRTAAIVSVTLILSMLYSATILSLEGWSSTSCDIWTAVGTYSHLFPKVMPLCVFLLITGCLYAYILVVAYRQRAAIAKVRELPQQATSLECHLPSRASRLWHCARVSPQVFHQASSALSLPQKPSPNPSHFLPKQSAKTSTSPSPEANSLKLSRTLSMKTWKGSPHKMSRKAQLLDRRSPQKPAVVLTRPSAKSDQTDLQSVTKPAKPSCLQHLNVPQSIGPAQSTRGAAYSPKKSSSPASSATCNATRRNKMAEKPVRRRKLIYPQTITCNLQSALAASDVISLDEGILRLPFSELSGNAVNSVTTTESDLALPAGQDACSITSSNDIGDKSPVSEIGDDDTTASSIVSPNSCIHLSNAPLSTNNKIPRSSQTNDSGSSAISSSDLKTAEPTRKLHKTTSGPGATIKNIPTGMSETLGMSRSQSAEATHLVAETAHPNFRQLPIFLPLITGVFPRVKPDKSSAVPARAPRSRSNSLKVREPLKSCSRPASCLDAALEHNPVQRHHFPDFIGTQYSSLTRSPSLTVSGGRLSIAAESASHHPKRRALWKSFRMFFMVWGIYFFTMIPILVSSLVFLSSSSPQEEIDLIVRIDITFLYLNSGINIFIYAWNDTRLRKSLSLVLRCRWSDI